LQMCARQTALERQDLSRTYLDHHELESIIIIIIIITIVISIVIAASVGMLLHHSKITWPCHMRKKCHPISAVKAIETAADSTKGTSRA